MLDTLAVSGTDRSILQAVTVVVLIGVIIIGYFLWSFVKGAGYEPVPGKILNELIEFSQPGPGSAVYDLGSGFGRIIIAVAQRTGARCMGVEVNPLKVWWTNRQIRAKGLSGRVSVVKSDLLDADISGADIVFVFLWDGIMQKLKEKALNEMKPGSLVASYYHEFRGWTPEKQDKKSRVFLYRIPAKV